MEADFSKTFKGHPVTFFEDNCLRMYYKAPSKFDKIVAIRICCFTKNAMPKKKIEKGKVSKGKKLLNC